MTSVKFRCTVGKVLKMRAVLEIPKYQSHPWVNWEISNVGRITIIQNIIVQYYFCDIWPLPRKYAKINFPSQTQKLRWSNENLFDENDCNENSVLARTIDTLESVHFLWWYPHETIKALYYISEFKCSKTLDTRNQDLDHVYHTKYLRISVIRYWLLVLPCARITMYDRP